ncbi:MAG: peptidoglycan DD-metalloendopeptidase family protein [Bdellovibrionales bacterium]|nr:peptidoglycan DD-metalloendopeptidase family protein [Bdellovibrionales bacterium]
MAALGAGFARAAPAPPVASGGGVLGAELAFTRKKIRSAEDRLLVLLRDPARQRERLDVLRELTGLLQKEGGLGKRRLTELRELVEELESRRGALRKRLDAQQERVRLTLAELQRSTEAAPAREAYPEGEELDAPRRRVMAELVDRSLKDIEAMRADLADADFLELKIAEERNQLEYLLQDLKEHEELLKFHRQLQADNMRKRLSERAGNLESYRKLKDAEAGVDELMGQFNARVEFEKAAELERRAASQVLKGAFPQLKGRLPFPARGKVVEAFGRAFDPASGLHVFRKGLSLDVGASQGVRAISAGQVVFSGRLPKYGNVLIVDHGAGYYSLCGRLGRADRGKGDWIAQGDVIGLTDESGSPLYFEIRSRNVAVDPLQWVAN